MNKNKDALRYDVGLITNVERTPQGFLKIPGFATRTGVFVYRDREGNVRRELRHPDDVMDPVSLATLKSVPVTLEHPPVMVTPENFKQYACGYTTERVEVNRDLIETDLIVAGAAAIESVENKERRELSCGYLADLVDEVGTFNGAPYDCRQKNIRYNHLAIVKSGRGGPEIRLRLDSLDAVMVDTKTIVVMGQEVSMPADAAACVERLLESHDEMKGRVYKLEAEYMKDKKDVDINQKGVSPEVPEEQMAGDGRSAGAKKDGEMSPGVKSAKGLDADDKEKDKKEDAEEDKKDGDEKDEKKKDGEEKKEDAETLKKQLDAMTAKCDSLQAKVDSFASSTMNPHVGAGKQDRKDSKDFQSQVRARVSLVRKAEQLVSPEQAEKFDSMSDDEIRAAAIVARHPKTDLKGKSTTYLEVRFDSLAEEFEGSNVIRNRMGSAMNERFDDAGTTHDPKAAREKMRMDAKNEFTQNLSAVKK